MPGIPPATSQAIIAAGRRCDRFGWVPGTAGNFSTRIDAETVAITVSGRHKGFLTEADLMVVGLDGTPRSAGTPSYETGLHLSLYRRDQAIGAVVHGHSVAATVLSLAAAEAITITGYELQKILGRDPAAVLHLKVFDNDQDIARLAARIEAAIDPRSTLGYLLRGHGVYVWGTDMGQAMARLEALEFILACELERTRRTTP